MTTIVTVASGKGGVGKSVCVTNLGLAIASRGHNVVLADLDLGGSNLATLFGEFETSPNLGAFLSRDIETLDDAMRPLRRNLSLIAGAGETLATASPNWAMKQRLLRHLGGLDVDVVLVDVGAGTGNHALDFFNAGEIRIVVTIPEPTASVDAYRFIKLATIRESVTRIPTRNPIRRTFETRNFESADDLWTTIDAVSGSVRNIQTGIAPWVIVNQAGDSHRSFERLRGVAQKFLGRDVRLLGEIPRSQEVVESVSTFLPVVESCPDSSASAAFHVIARRLDDELIRSGIARRAGLSESSELPDLTRMPIATPR